MATSSVTPQPTAWDAAGNPIAPAQAPTQAPASVTAWDAAGNPIQPQTGGAPPQSGTLTSGLKNVAAGVNDAVNDVGGGVENAVEHPLDTISNIGKGIWNSLPPVQLANRVEQSLPIIDAYEKARSGGASVSDALTQADLVGRQHDNNMQTIQKLSDDFKKNPTRTTASALSKAGLLAASMFSGAGEAAAAEGAGEAGAAEAATTTSDPISNALSNAPSETSVASYLQSNAAPAASAKDVAAGASARDAGLSAGEAETVPPSADPIQPALQQGIRDSLNKVASDEGLKPIADEVSVRDAAQNLADQFKARSQAMFDNIEIVTNVNVTSLRNRINSLDQQIDDIAVTDPGKASVLQEQKLSYEAQAERAFNDARAKGLDVDQARGDWNKNLRANELSQKIRSSDDGKIGSALINPSKLTRPLQRMTDSVGGRPGPLNQLMGDDAATALVQHSENAREALQEIKDFVPKSATGQKAFAKVISNNTSEVPSKLGAITGKTSTKIDWNGVVKDLGNLGPKEQEGLGTELGQARQYATRKAAMQTARKYVLRGAGTVGAVAGLDEAKNLVEGR